MTWNLEIRILQHILIRLNWLPDSAQPPSQPVKTVRESRDWIVTNEKHDLNFLTA